MFVLFCPHCGEKREEEEFGYGGEAFIARPATPETLDDEAWGDYLFMRKNPKGWTLGNVVAQHGLPQVLRREAQHRDERRRRNVDAVRWPQSL